MIGPKVDGQCVLSMHFVFYIFDGWSVAKFTGSMLCLCILSLHFLLMVGCEVYESLWVFEGRSWSLCGRSWAALVAYVGGLGPLLGLCGLSWAALGAYVGGLGPLLGLCGRSWAALGAHVSSLGLLLRLCGLS